MQFGLRMSTELFTPRCLSCQYDLSGLADGRCPECGTAFTHADLLGRAAHKEADLKTVAQGLTSAMLVIAYLGALAILLSETNRVAAVHGGLVLIWVIAGAWVAAWYPILRERPQYLVTVVLPTVASMWELWTQFPQDPYRIALVTSVLGLTMLAAAARFAPRIVLVALAMTLACLLAARGELLREAGVAAWTEGNFWTAYADIRPGQVYRQYPLTPDEAVKLGSWVAWSGVVLLCGLVGYVVLAWGRLRSEWGWRRA